MLRLRKNLKSLIITHPSWFIRTVLAISKPFIRYRGIIFILFLKSLRDLNIGKKDVLVSLSSVKFMNKIRYVHSLEELEKIIPLEHIQIPECVLQ